MKQYRVFKWDDEDNLIFLGEDMTKSIRCPGQEYSFEDSDQKEKDWIISEVHDPNPPSFRKPNGTEYHPDSILILRPADEE